MSENKTKGKLIKCVVVSDKMQKSRVAKIERKVKHPKLGKVIKKTTKIMFHDENNTSHVGDHVVIRETRPLSANKSFELHEITKKRSDSVDNASVA